jgi:hypothetical protein
MRLSQFSTTDATKNWGVDTPTVAHFDHLLAAYGDFVYCQGISEETIQKRNRVDGSLVWQKDFNIGYDRYGAAKILVDNQGNIYTQKNGNVYKYNSDGNLVWTCDVVEGDTGNIVLGDVMIDGSKLVGYSSTKIYTISSSGVVGLVIEDSDLTDIVSRHILKLDSTGDILVSFEEGSYGYFRTKKYDGYAGQLVWKKNFTGFTGSICFDSADNVWVANPVYTVWTDEDTWHTRLHKLGKNTGNTLLDSLIYTPNAVDILSISNNNIAVIYYSAPTLLIEIRDSNAILLASQTYGNITRYNSAVITV